MQQHFDCTIADKGAFAGEASTAAAGMLCPGAESFDALEPTNIYDASLKIYRTWTREVEDTSGISVQYRQEGMFRLLMSQEEGLAAQEKVDQRLSHWVAPEEVVKVLPGVSPLVQGAVFFPSDAQVHPVHLARSLKMALVRRGCQIQEGVVVQSLISESGRVTGVLTSRGELHADVTVIAAGAWSEMLLFSLGVKVPVFPVKGEMLAVRCPNVDFPYVVQGPNGMMLPRLDGTYSLGVTAERVGYDKHRTTRAISTIYRNVSRWFAPLESAEFLTSWMGIRPGSPDGNPYIGSVPGADNLFVATGHYGMGIFLAPITAVMLRQLITEGESSALDNMSSVRPDRFNH